MSIDEFEKDFDNLREKKIKEGFLFLFIFSK
jgi:hypothetical protein